MKKVTYHPTIYQTIPISLDLTDYWNKTSYQNTLLTKLRKALGKVRTSPKISEA